MKQGLRFVSVHLSEIRLGKEDELSYGRTGDAKKEETWTFLLHHKTCDNSRLKDLGGFSGVNPTEANRFCLYRMHVPWKL